MKMIVMMEVELILAIVDRCERLHDGMEIWSRTLRRSKRRLGGWRSRVDLGICHDTTSLAVGMPFK